MQREIGSNFWLNPDEKYTNTALGSPQQFGCDGEDYVWLSTGRSAIRTVIQTMELKIPTVRKVAVLPSFTCETVIEPFPKAGYDVYYYPVDDKLFASSDVILSVAKEKDASIVLFHRYFGFNTLDGQVDEMCDTLRKWGKFTIEDCTQCLYSDISRSDADFYIGSIRKWTGTPDGGFAVSRCGIFDYKPQQYDRTLESAKVKASYTKYRYLFEHVGDKSEMLSMYRHAEDILDKQAELFRISDTSSKVQGSLDIELLKRKRRENFKILQESLHEVVRPLFFLNSGGEVPLYFPIFVEDRDSLQQYLIKNDIYAPVVWPKSEIQPIGCNGAENAYNHLLCIPIDQRYDADDMNRIIEVINKYYR